ncbi:MAG: efflux RND transporter periplasmic adaptor subunit [Woeseiaceae bacterium]
MNDFMERHAGALQLAFVVGVVGLALLLSSSLRPDSSGPSSVARSNETVVTIVTPAAAPFRPIIELNGVVQARTITRIVPQVSGRVVKVGATFRPGASVAKGNILFVIDPSDYTLAVERTLAEIAIARSDLARLEAEAAAEREIWQGQFPNRQIPDLIARVPQIAAAEARIQSGDAARKTAELSLGRTTVRAPFDARILDTQLDVGQVVSGSAAVGSMFSIDSLEIAVPVSADQRKLIGPLGGQRVSIVAPSSGQPIIDGKLVRAAAALDERTRLGTLYVTTDKPELLTAGEFVTVRIDGEDAPDSYRVPAAALTSRDRLWVVEGGRLAGRTVEVLGREADMAVVRVFDEASGVVAIPPANARDGLEVSIRSANGLASVDNDSDASN